MPTRCRVLSEATEGMHKITSTKDASCRHLVLPISARLQRRFLASADFDFSPVLESEWHCIPTPGQAVKQHQINAA